MVHELSDAHHEINVGEPFVESLEGRIDRETAAAIDEHELLAASKVHRADRLLLEHRSERLPAQARLPSESQSSLAAVQRQHANGTERLAKVRAIELWNAREALVSLPDDARIRRFFF